MGGRCTAFMEVSSTAHTERPGDICAGANLAPRNGANIRDSPPRGEVNVRAALAKSIAILSRTYARKPSETGRMDALAVRDGRGRRNL